MLQSISVSTIKQYTCTYRLWWQYCLDTNTPTFEACAKQVIQFLQHLFASENQRYGTFNTQRPALSLILPHDLGSNTLIKRYLKGISRTRPSKPKYNNTWDPAPVLNYLGHLDITKLTNLSCKVATLLALVTGGRIQTISLIRLSNLVQDADKIQLFISNHIKTSLVSNTQPCLQIPFLKDKLAICPATALLKYIEVTHDLRNKENFIFLTCVQPHKRASSQAISRWVKQTLQSAGVNTSLFKTHFTRYSATSTAFRAGLDTATICRTAGWSEKTSTFAKYYNRPLHDGTQLANAVLNSLGC